MRAGEDGWPVLREFAFRADREVAGTRWSYCRDFGRTRLVMIDSRAGRVLDPPEDRSMLDPHEWGWLEEHAAGDFDHLLIGTSLPFLLAPGLHYLESWNEAVCNGAWGRPAAVAGEKVRQALDLEHWAAFGSSLDRVVELMRTVGTGDAAPASIVALSGDVHHAYLAEVGFPRGTGMRSAVYQATCSPFRNPLDDRERRMIRFACAKGGTLVGKLLARAAGVADPPVRWRFTSDDAAVLRQPGLLPRARRAARQAVAAEDRPRGERGLLAGDGLRARAGLVSCAGNVNCGIEGGPGVLRRFDPASGDFGGARTLDELSTVVLLNVRRAAV